MSLSARVVSDVVQWIENNLDKPLHIEDVAEHAGYSMWYFQRMFTHHQGISLGRYIRERRLNLAKQALLTTDIPIYDICLMYGFDSQQVFTRMFTKKFQCSPGRYRKTFRESHKIGTPA